MQFHFLSSGAGVLSAFSLFCEEPIFASARNCDTRHNETTTVRLLASSALRQCACVRVGLIVCSLVVVFYMEE